jgi:Fe-S-cluster containining protein
MPTLAVEIERMRRTWEAIAARYQAYHLALPGSARFICQAELCDAHCCRAFSVNLGDAEVARMQRDSGLELVEFLECEDGAPITLPLAQPYLLGRGDNRCRLLAENLSCTQYHGRPNACRLYPHFVVFIDPIANRPVTADLEAIGQSFAQAAGPLVPLLLRHVECPGFTGPPMEAPEWEALLRDTYALQYHAG